MVVFIVGRYTNRINCILIEGISSVPMYNIILYIIPT